MPLLTHIDLNIFSLILCGVMLHDTYKRTDQKNIQNILFIGLIISNMSLLILEALTWIFDGSPGSMAAFLNLTANILSFIVNPFPAFLWALYTQYQVTHDEHRLRKLLVPFSLPVILFGILALLNPITKALFYIDKNNFYHRGYLYVLLVAIFTFYFAHSYLTIFHHRIQIKKQYFYTLLMFPLPLIAGGIMQGLFYGLTLMWGGMTLSLFFIFNNIQTEKLTTDFLTGVNNRMGFEQYFSTKISNAQINPFGGIILDIDNFKNINDHYGHVAGDNALQITAELLRASLRKEDFIARYGGDEFIILANVRYHSTLEIIANRINKCVKEYNLTSNEPYTLDLSIGYDIFDKSLMNEDTFIKHIDALMYNNKRSKVADQGKEQLNT